MVWWASRLFFICCTWLHAIPLAYGGVMMRLLCGSVAKHAVGRACTRLTHESCSMIHHQRYAVYMIKTA